MRVTDSLIFQTATLDTGRAREAAQQAQEVASTGTRLVHPSDDPSGAGLLVAFHMSSDRADAIGKAASAASDELGVADGALDTVGTALTRVRELTMQYASSGYSAAQRASAATEVASLTTGIVAALNSQVGDRYLFGGTKDGTPPFDASGNYLGDAGVRQVEIAPGVLQQANVRADVVIKGAGGGTDLFQTLSALQAALNANDPAGVQATLAGLDAGISQVSAGRAQIGTSMHAFDTAVTASQAASDSAKKSAGELSDADVVQASIQLQATQTALQASLTATAQSFRLSLLDFLK